MKKLIGEYGWIKLVIVSVCFIVLIRPYFIKSKEELTLGAFSYMENEVISGLEPTSTDIEVFDFTEGSKKFLNIQDVRNGMSSGCYSVNDNLLLVRSSESSAITLVVPSLNYFLKTKKGDFGTVKSFSLEASVHVPERLKKCLNFFKKNDFQYNVISDMDLADLSSYNSSELVIMVDDMTFVTSEMRNTFKRYLNEGGNGLLFCTDFFNAKCWVKSDSVLMNIPCSESYDNCNRSVVNFSHLGEPKVEKMFGFGYGRGGYPESNTKLEIIDKDHPVFTDLELQHVPLSSSVLIGPAMYELNKDLSLIEFVSSFKELASIASEYGGVKQRGGVYEFELSSGGKLITMGTAEWFDKLNIERSPELEQIAVNAINYLLN